jgi:hypothetical protein
MEIDLMSKKTMKVTAMVLLAGTTFQLGSCFAAALRSLWRTLPITLLTEFTLDNTSIIDVFGDDGSNSIL